MSDLFEIQACDQLGWQAPLLHQAVQTTNQPPGRSAHAAVSLAGRFFVHGGFTEDGAFGDLWEFGADSWEQLEPTGYAPAARSGHSCVALDDDQFLLFGGVGGDGQAYSDLHVYTASSNCWRVIEASAPPLPRYNHRAVMVRGAMVLTGGCVDDGTGLVSVTTECFALDML